MADHSKPVLAGTSYPDFRDQLMARIDDALRSLDPAVTSPTNIPTGSVRWSSAAKKWQIWSGTAWVDLESEYAINIGGYAAKLKTKRKIALSGGATGTATEFDGSADITIPVTALDATKLEGDIAWARVSANAPATATRWPAFSEVTDKPAAYPPDVSLLGEAALVSLADLQWLGTPVGGYITPKTAPPTDDPRFRYVLCTAGQTGSGGYNEGVLTSESVTGTAPLIEATATVSLSGSPFNSETIHLINTEERFVGAGAAEAFEDDSFQGWELGMSNSSVVNAWRVQANTGGSSDPIALRVEGLSAGSPRAVPVQGGYGSPRIGDHTQPRTHRLVHYRRIK